MQTWLHLHLPQFQLYQVLIQNRFKIVCQLVRRCRFAPKSLFMSLFWIKIYCLIDLKFFIKQQMMIMFMIKWKILTFIINVALPIELNLVVNASNFSSIGNSASLNYSLTMHHTHPNLTTQYHKELLLLSARILI